MTNQNKQTPNPQLRQTAVSRSFFKNSYRIISDDYAGYEAQVKYWFFPFFWFEMIKSGYLSNTWVTLEDAKNFIEKKKKKRKVYWVS